jgi:hypothetical protein
MKLTEDTNLTYRDFGDLSSEQAAQAQEIYEEAFPARLRVPFDELMAVAGDPNRLQVAAVRGEAVAGFYIASLLPSGWSFLEYIAVASEMRSHGVGRTVFMEFVDQVGMETPVILEVEPPEDAPDYAERTIRDRRVTFYLRLGLRVLDVAEYEVPNVDGSGTERFLLMVRTIDPDRPDTVELRRLVTELYVHGYGVEMDGRLPLRALTSIGN